MEEWFTPGRFALLSACLIVACFPGVMVGRDAFFFRDFAIFSYPLAAYHKYSFWQGELPLWNPYNDCGLPFLAQWNTMVFYPLSLIYLLLPLSWSVSLFCLFHWWLGGLGMYLLARCWTGNRPAGAMAGFAFLFNGVVLSCLKWPNNIAALAWMPWLVLAVDRAARGGRRAIALAALAGAMQMLAGAPEVILLTWGVAGSFTLARMLVDRAQAGRILSRFLAVAALVAGVCAVQLLPFLDLLEHSQRDGAFRGSQWPMPPWGWANFLLPLFRMFPSYHNVHAQPGQYWISTYYVSLVVVLFAIVALRKHRNPKVWLLGGLLLFSMWMALGDRGLLYKLLRATVPGLGMMRYPIKFIVLAGFALPLLGAFGLKEILESPQKSARTIWLPALTLGLIIAVLIVYEELHPFRYSRAFMTAENGAARILVLAAAAGLFIAWIRRPDRTSKWLLPGCFALLVADGLTHATWQNPVAPRWVYEGPGPEMNPVPTFGQGRAMISPEAAETVDHLKLDQPAEDVMASRMSLYCNLNLLERIPKADGFFAIYPREMSLLQDALYLGTNAPPPGVLDFLGITQLTASGSWDKWAARSNPLPLISSPARVRVVTNDLAAFLSPDFDPRLEVLVSSWPLSQTNLAGAAFTAVDWKPHRISFHSEADGAALAVVSQTFYHAWRAAVDGRPVDLWKANGAFQGLLLPAGSHDIVLEYHDPAFRLGRWISTLGAGFVIFLLLCRKNQDPIVSV